MRYSESVHRRDRGFSLLEVLLALLILVMISGAIFGITRSSLQLNGALMETQRESMHRQAFFDLMRKQLSELPGNAVLDLTFEDPPGNAPYLSSLTVQNVPMVFSWGGNPMAVKAVRIETQTRRDGFLDIVMQYYDVEVLEEDNATSEGVDEALDERAEPVARVVLLEGVKWFEWQVLDERSGDWLTEWDNRGRLPVMLQLDVAFANEENQRQIFWIPPKQNPVTLMRQLATGQGAGTPAPGGGTPGGGGQGGGPAGGGSPPPPTGRNSNGAPAGGR